MAISEDIWKKAKFYFESGKSLTYINDETGISRGQISKKAKIEKWEKGNKKKQLKADIVDFEKKNETILQEKETLVYKLAELEDYEITLMNELVYEETKKASLVNSTSMLALIRTNQLLTKNKTYEKINIGDGVQQFEPRELNPMDLKNIGDTIDKLSITTNVNERHAKSSIEVNNAIQHNTKRVTIARRRDR